MGVHAGDLDRALVPIENSLEGSVNATLDALALETEDVAIVGEVVHPIRHCLIAREQLELDEIEVVVSHPQATAQCARFIRTRLPERAGARGQLDRRRGPAWWPSTTARGRRSANQVAAERYGSAGIARGRRGRDRQRDQVRVARAGRGRRRGSRGAREPGTGSVEDRDRVLGGRSRRSRLAASRASANLPSRDVNLTRIESRPRKQGLGPLHVLPRPRRSDSRAARRGGAGRTAPPRGGRAGTRLVSGRLSPLRDRFDGSQGQRIPSLRRDSPSLHWRQPWTPHGQAQWGSRRLSSTSDADVTVAGCSS